MTALVRSWVIARLRVAFVAQQVALTVDNAIDKSAALRVIVFGGSAGNARTVVECPVMAVRYRNEAARAAKTAHLKQVARDQVWLAVLNGRPPMARPGTSVVGGYVALADAAQLTGGPTRGADVVGWHRSAGDGRRG